jgi:hypothetical protein
MVVVVVVVSIATAMATAIRTIARGTMEVPGTMSNRRRCSR